LNRFERYLTVSVFLCIVTGVALRQFSPEFFQLIGRLSGRGDFTAAAGDPAAGGAHFDSGVFQRGSSLWS
jgi:hypothetical protein